MTVLTSLVTLLAMIHILVAEYVIKFVTPVASIRKSGKDSNTVLNE